MTFLTALVKALREIRYMQSEAMSAAHVIPPAAFARLVKEIGDAAKTSADKNGIRWEKDALFALQECTEHVLVMLFEMTYYFQVITLTRSNKMAIHAKRQTIKPVDMR